MKMNSIQSFRYKRKRITVIFCNNKVWFKLGEISQLLKSSKKETIHKLSCEITDYMLDEDKLSKSMCHLVSASGLQYLIDENVRMKPQRKEKLEDLCG